MKYAGIGAISSSLGISYFGFGSKVLIPTLSADKSTTPPKKEYLPF